MGYYIDIRGKRVELEDKEHLNCSNNQLAKLDLNNNINLKYLYCNYNQLTQLDVSNNIKLEYLYCDTKTNLIGIKRFLNNKNITINQI